MSLRHTHPPLLLLEFQYWSTHEGERAGAESDGGWQAGGHADKSDQGSCYTVGRENSDRHFPRATDPDEATTSESGNLSERIDRLLMRSTENHAMAPVRQASVGMHEASGSAGGKLNEC
jgi:hypothetical protein